MAYTPKLTYKGRPLVRCGNDIYYGSMKDPFVVYLQVLSTKKENGVDVADKVHIVLLSTDESKPLPERIARQANKVGLYNALSFGDTSGILTFSCPSSIPSITRISVPSGQSSFSDNSRFVTT